jgi:hypothetical protein
MREIKGYVRISESAWLMPKTAAAGRSSALETEWGPAGVTSAGAPAQVGIKIDAARVDIGYWSIKQLILTAYGLPSYQLSAA